MKARLLLIDNYDSFTYNLVQAFLVLGADVQVVRNDRITVDEALAAAPSHLCISPGPGTPRDAGVSMDVIRAFAGRVPVFGVCLGHQSLVEAFGGRVVRNYRLMHGKTSRVTHDGRGLFAGLPNPVDVGRYHSLVAERATLVRLTEGSVGRALELARAGGLALYGDLFGLLAGLPRLDANAIHAFAEKVARRGDDGERDFRTVAFLLDWWLKSLLRQGATGEALPDLAANEGALRQRLLQGAGLDRWMQVWEKVAHLFARADAVNLDRKQVVLGSLFAFQSAIR